MMRLAYTLFLVAISFGVNLIAQNNSNINHLRFKQLEQELPTPNTYRTASGSPGHQYYQQRADYNMQITLDDANQRIYGEEVIIYFNQSPDALSYLWLQLDQNVRAQNSLSSRANPSSLGERVSTSQMKRILNDFDGGFKIEYVKQNNGQDLPYTINETMMRVDLPQVLKPGSSYTFKIKWWYNINDRMQIGGRSGFEYFEKDSNYLYTIAQFFPRMAVYNETEGWQHKQFLGTGEFTLPFGNYKVSITAPADHVVSATGTLKNASNVLTATQRQRLEKAKNSDKPLMVITQDEAEKNESSRSAQTKTWVFEAENVRDFAFASSRKFIWDAQGVNVGGKNVLCMSYYPKEGNPLWERYSTKVVAHTIKTYSKFTIDYPYPVAISVHAKSIGMEYPMICFNGGRPEEDGTYSEATKHGMISVIIHEVGHNFFPMIINSDERQWSWMDEGLNTFVQFLTEQEWDIDYPSRRGPAHKIVDYMKGDPSNIVPIMTNSESIRQFGNNAYGKPATALNILRETVMGRELFDFAFKEYCKRWAFKHPNPADFFRTMEDASAVDLDWFWRAWFYTTDYVDLAIDEVKYYQIDSRNPSVSFSEKKKTAERENKGITHMRNKDLQTVVNTDPETRDFYNTNDRFAPNKLDEAEYKKYRNSLSEEERKILDTNLHFYEVKLQMLGGIPMPVILMFTLEDGSEELKKLPAEIWRKDTEVSKVFFFDKPVINIQLDPYLETADINTNNNAWPAKQHATRFQMFKDNSRGRYSGAAGENPMQRAKRAKAE